jgi:UDP-N-acetylglucosamine 2-epimerase (non-hydrolysing)
MPSQPIHIVAVVGARPNFIKMSSLYRELEARPRFRVTLLHTRQHYDEKLSEVFFQQLDMPRPDVQLEIPRGNHAAQTADTMREFDAALEKLGPVDLVLVVGDVNSTLACSLVAVKRGLKVAHVEAGLRSFNWAMPEEINRVITDRISDYLFTPSADADENLAREGIPADRIFRVGNVMIDTLLAHRDAARGCRTPQKLGLEPQEYAVVTLHRQENVEDADILGDLWQTLSQVASRLPVVFPVHPRTRQRLESLPGADLAATAGLQTLEPLGYLEFLDLVANARVVLTDSGGLQEETTILGIPCLTLRGETERPVTVSEGTNRVVGVREPVILAALEGVLSEERKTPASPALWDGQAARRVVEVLERVLP